MKNEIKKNVVQSLKVGSVFAVLLHAVLSLTINVGVPAGEQIFNLLADIAIVSTVVYVLMSVKRATYKELVRPSILIGAAVAAVGFEIWLVNSGVLPNPFLMVDGVPIGHFSFLVKELVLPRFAWSIVDGAAYSVIAFALLSAKLAWDRRHLSVQQA